MGLRKAFNRAVDARSAARSGDPEVRRGVRSGLSYEDALDRADEIADSPARRAEVRRWARR